ncbi:MAG: hypothetical protein PHT54_03080 [Candidatus Nanoarchaeia archaeon]|nr:hypothetical protein [Candidatus Nanoarchaeia archaeon]
MKTTRKIGLYLAFLSLPYLTGCSSPETKKQDLLEKFAENPKQYEEQIDSMINELYRLKINANNGHIVKQGYVNPGDVFLVYCSSGEGDYLMLKNSNTNELLDLRYVDGTTQLGSLGHRAKGLKKELVNGLFDKADGLFEGIDKIGDKGKDILFIIENGGF